MKKITSLWLFLLCLTFTAYAQFPAPYCEVTGGTDDVEPITIIQFADIDETFPTTIGGPALVDNLSIVGNVTPGDTYTIVLGGNTGGNWTNSFRVYFDWNQDNDFVDAGEGFYVGQIVNSTGGPGSETTSIAITVPADALEGDTRMRVVKRFLGADGTIGDPCAIGSTFGQARDFTLNVGEGSGGSGDSYIVDFEGDGETKPGYASGTVNLSGLDWNMTEGLIALASGSDPDYVNGLRSARMRGYGTSEISMLEDKEGGLGEISFDYRRYGTDVQVEWVVEYSTDQGDNWIQAGDSFTALDSDDVQSFNALVEVEGDVRIRIRTVAETGTSNRRLNIDDIELTDYTAGGGGEEEPCLDWLNPTSTTGWNDFNTIYGGAPTQAGGCPFNEITDFQVWASEAYSVDNFEEGVEYTFSMCNGPGAGSWIPEFTIIAPSGNVDAFGLGDGDGCSITWTATESGTYFIVINEADACGGGTNTATNNGFPALTCTGNGGGGGDNNWECADAIALECGDTSSGTTAGATNSGGNASPDVFYSYTGNGEVEFITVSLCGSGYDTSLRVFESCDNLTVGAEVAFNDDSCGLQSELTFESDGTTTYIILVEGFGTSSGTYTLELTCEFPPAPPACGGIFTDTGGETGNYSNSEDVTWTITPDEDFYAVTVVFNSFDVEANWDALYVYDGPDVNSPLISSGNPATNSGFPAGGYYGTTIPGPFTSTHESGALTFRFRSDGSVNRAGWVADIMCDPVPPFNDLIENAYDAGAVDQPYVDADARTHHATVELLNPVGCAIAGAPGVWYKFTAVEDGMATALIGSPEGVTVAIFFSADSMDVDDETDLTYVESATNPCGSGSETSIETMAGQSYYVYVVNTGGMTDVTIDITTLSVNENEINGFSFYPNPAGDIINLTSNNSIENVVIYSITGQVVSEKQIQATTSQMDISSLDTGVYLLKVTSNGQVGTYRMIKE